MKFDFLGMSITIRDDKKIEIEVKKQIQEDFEWIHEDVDRTLKTAANIIFFCR